MLTLEELQAAIKSYNMNNNTTYYGLLGINNDADNNAVKKAFRKLALKYHPDRGGSGVMFKEINQAYEILGEPSKRKAYDRELNNITSAQPNIFTNNYNNNNNNNNYEPPVQVNKNQYDQLVEQLVNPPLSLKQLVSLLGTLVKLDINSDRLFLLDSIDRYLKNQWNIDTSSPECMKMYYEDNFQKIVDYLTKSNTLESQQFLLCLYFAIRADFTAFNLKFYQHLSTQLDNADKAEALIAYAQILVLNKDYSQCFEILQQAQLILTDSLMPAFDEAKTICLEKTQAALYIACKVNDLEKVKALLTIKELIPSPSLIIAAAHSKSLNMVEFICKVLEGNVSYSDAHKWNAAHYAASTNSLDIIRFFHEKYPDLLQEYTGIGACAGDESIVIVAARYNAPTVLQFLCANKYELDHVDVKGWTALNRAYNNSNLPLFTLLLHHGANPNSYYDATTKYSLMHQACYYNSVDYVKALLATNAIVLSKDSSGKLPTDIANANAKDGFFFSGNASAKEIVKLLADYETGSQCKANNSNAFNCK